MLAKAEKKTLETTYPNCKLDVNNFLFLHDAPSGYDIKSIRAKATEVDSFDREILYGVFANLGECWAEESFKKETCLCSGNIPWQIFKK